MHAVSNRGRHSRTRTNSVETQNALVVIRVIKISLNARVHVDRRLAGQVFGRLRSRRRKRREHGRLRALQTEPRRDGRGRNHLWARVHGCAGPLVGVLAGLIRLGGGRHKNALTGRVMNVTKPRRCERRNRGQGRVGVSASRVQSRQSAGVTGGETLCAGSP